MHNGRIQGTIVISDMLQADVFPFLRHSVLAPRFINSTCYLCDDNGNTTSIPKNSNTTSNRSVIGTFALTEESPADQAPHRQSRTNLPSKDHLLQTRSRTTASSILSSSLPRPPHQTSLQQLSKQIPKRCNVSLHDLRIQSSPSVRNHIRIAFLAVIAGFFLPLSADI